MNLHAALIRRSGIRVLMPALIAVAMAGCASTEGIAPVATTTAATSVGVDAATAMPQFAADWWRAFRDDALVDLVERALAGNPSLKVAQARLERAQAATAGAQANSGPQLNAQADATRQKFTANGIYPPPLGGSTQTLANAQIGGSWELDFFGRNRAAIEAAVGAERAAAADAQAARVMLASNVARSYIQLGRLQAQRQVAERSLGQRQETLALTRQRVQSGLDSNVELRQGESALPETRQQIEQLDEQIALTRHALAALTAQPPSAVDTVNVTLNTVQAVPVPAAIPADLLARRADINAARWRIEAATGEVQSAKAQFYPNINLTAFIGLSSIGLNQLVRAGSEQFGVGPAIHLPIFDAGRLRANLRGRTADLDAAIESYNGAVLDAVHDVADQVSSVQSVGRQQTEQAAALASSEQAYDLALQRYRAGLSPLLTVLSAESTVLNQRRLEADLKARALDAHVALIRALGGGYLADGNMPAHAAQSNDRPAGATPPPGKRS